MNNEPKLIVSPQSVVRLAVTLRDANGEELQADISQLDVVIGYGQLLPKVEEAIIGLTVGERRELLLEPREAFGEHDESKVVEFDRQEFPATVASGDLYDVETSDGVLSSLKVLEVFDDYVVADMNHPLAGASVTLQFEVVAIRPADKRDVQSINNARKNGQFASTEQLLPLNRLLKGHPRR